EVLQAQALVRAALPRPHVHPRALAVDPDVQALGQEVVQRRRHGGGLARRGFHVIAQHGDAPVRVRLRPAALDEGIVLLVDAVDDAEGARVVDYPVQNLRHVGAPLVAYARAVRAGRGDVPQQRLLSGTAGRVDHVVHGTGLV